LVSQERDTITLDDFAHDAVATSNYTYAELAEIYNQARVDYIVPMPMNARRMQQYVEAYDLDLDASMVALDKDDGEPNGVCMLGIRENRTWITRLGVIPERRRRKTGEFLMRVMINESTRRDKDLVQLEVIKGNEPAYHLFRKLGFEVTRELLVIRRPPGQVLPEPYDNLIIEPIPADEIASVLEEREPIAAWTEETASLLNTGNLEGLRVTISSGETGWVIFQSTPFQLQHLVLSPGGSDDLREALIAAVHQTHPLQDTKVENVPVDHPTWPIFQKLGYFDSFRRIEMTLTL
jgi:ribosomal protein S18 acetylase RimI-like enzyme